MIQAGRSSFHRLAGFLLALTLVASLPALYAARAGDSDAALVQQMAQATDLQSAGGPYRIRAHFRLLKTPGAVEGTYQLAWVSPGQWREEVSAPGYNEVRVAAAGNYWESNSAGRRSWVIRQLASTINVKSHFRADPSRLVETSPDADAKPGTRCFQLRTDDPPAARYCLVGPMGAGEATAGRGASDGTSAARSEYASEAYDYSNFSAWKQRSFPRTMSASLNGERLLEVTVEQLSDLTPDPGLFSPPPGAEQRCLTPEAPELLESAEPKYPADAAKSGTDGVVAVYVRIAADGTVRDPFIVRTPGAEFNRPTLEALGKWRFRPASCSGRAVPFDTTIEVAFQLR